MSGKCVNYIVGNHNSRAHCADLMHFANRFAFGPQQTNELWGTLKMKLDTTNTHPDMDYDQHVNTYEKFIRGSIIGIIALIALLAGMAFSLV